MRRIISIVILLLSCLLTVSAEISQTLAIVTGVNSELQPLTAKELRRLYLGMNLKINDNPLTPVQNYSDDILHEVFLQKVMYMTSRSYQRQLKIQTIRKGVTPPIQFSSDESIVNLLKRDKTTITYMWKSHADNNPNIRVLQTF